jgi:HSP20 family protein
VGTAGGPDDPGRRLPEDLLEAALRLAGAERRAGPGEETDFPAVDIFETAAEIVVEAELPGVDPAQVAAFVDRGALVIEGVKEEDAPPGRVAFLCMERSFGPFRRVVPLLGAVDLARATAVCRAGVLRIRLPRIEDKRGRRIAIPIAVEPGP